MLPRCSPLWTEWCPSSTFWATRLCRGSSAAQNDAVNQRAKVHLGGWGGATFARVMASAGKLLHRMRTFAQLPVLLIVDLGTNDLCSVPASANGVVDQPQRIIPHSDVAPSQPLAEAGSLPVCHPADSRGMLP